MSEISVAYWRISKDDDTPAKKPEYEPVSKVDRDWADVLRVARYKLVFPVPISVALPFNWLWNSIHLANTEEQFGNNETFRQANIES